MQGMNIRAYFATCVSSRCEPARARRVAGVTLVEMLVVMVISAIMIAAAIPSFTSYVASNEINGEVSSMASSLRQARFEALKRSTPVSVCPTLNPNDAAPACAGGAIDNTLGWATGWIVFTDRGVTGTIDGNDTVISVQPAFTNSGGIIPAVNNYVVTFQPNGMAIGMAGRFNFRSKAAPSDITQMTTFCISLQGTTRTVKRTNLC
jgi:type IV fimbrial biogenesis protein FimT